MKSLTKSIVLLLSIFSVSAFLYTAPFKTAPLLPAAKGLEAVPHVAAAEPAPEPKPVIATIVADSLNVRSGPGIEHPVLDWLEGGDQVEVLREENGWLKVEYSSFVGWIAGSYASLSSAVPEEEVAEVAAAEVSEELAAAGECDFTQTTCLTYVDIVGLRIRQEPKP
jgi:uncharacterized protein YgiM (DUF1202 family)